MPAESGSPSERIVAAFKKLRDSSKHINAVSAELAQPVAALEEAIKRLNLGVACWTVIEESSDGLERSAETVGYARVRGEWRLMVSTGSGPEHSPERWSSEEWPLNEAPLYLRIKAVDKLADLVEGLVEVSDSTVERMKKKVAPTQELAAAVKALTQVAQKK